MTIRQFRQAYFFLSNFYPAPVVLDGVEYPTVEHAFQAGKTHDADAREQVRRQPAPERAKARGQRVPLREDWEEIRVALMRDLLAKKFAPGTELAEQLLATGGEQIVEGNWWGDTFWGVDTKTRRGKNMLGKLLMEIRGNLSRA